MKLLFVHGSEKLKEDRNGNYYTDGSYSQEVWDRYLSIFDSVTVIFRKDKTIYETNYAKQKFQHFDKNRIKFVEIPDMTSSNSSFFSLEKRKNLNNIIEKTIIEHDCLIARLPSNIGDLAINYALKHKKSYLVEVVGCPWGTLWNHSYKGKLLAFPRYFNTKKSIENAPYAIFVTNEFLQRRYPCKGKSIGCSDVVLTPFKDDLLENRLNKIKHKSNNSPIILGTVAAIDVRYKGQENVIRSISKLNKQGYNFEYYLAGGGDDSYLKSVAEKYKVIDKVKFLGSLPREKIFDFLDSIDIYIQPSRQEGLPRALVEAMSRGCPSLGSRTGGIPELLNKELIFEPGKVSEICESLKKMDITTMLKEAKRSFQKAKEYDKDLLDQRRIMFLKEFAKQ
jgi:glycosyltransferase involved in cell wall biosynthesis